MENGWDDMRPLGALRNEEDLNALRFWCPKLMTKLEREQAIWDRVRHRFPKALPKSKEAFVEQFRRELALAELWDAVPVTSMIQ
jgi:hypothetical protein